MIELLLVALLQAPIPGSVSKPDASGAFTVVLDIPGQPVHVPANSEWEQRFRYRLPPNVTVRRVRSFLGVDRGDVFEGHVLVLAEDYYLHARSPHKEGLATYDAWAAEPASYRVGPGGGDVYVFAYCKPTVPGRGINCHVGVILELGR